MSPIILTAEEDARTGNGSRGEGREESHEATNTESTLTGFRMERDVTHGAEFEVRTHTPCCVLRSPRCGFPLAAVPRLQGNCALDP